MQLPPEVLVLTLRCLDNPSLAHAAQGSSALRSATAQACNSISIANLKRTALPSLTKYLVRYGQHHVTSLLLVSGYDSEGMTLAMRELPALCPRLQELTLEEFNPVQLSDGNGSRGVRSDSAVPPGLLQPEHADDRECISAQCCSGRADKPSASRGGAQASRVQVGDRPHSGCLLKAQPPQPVPHMRRVHAGGHAGEPAPLVTRMGGSIVHDDLCSRALAAAHSPAPCV